MGTDVCLCAGRCTGCYAAVQVSCAAPNKSCTCEWCVRVLGCGWAGGCGSGESRGSAVHQLIDMSTNTVVQQLCVESVRGEMCDYL